MAGIGLFNFDIDGKGLEPILVLGAASIGGFFLFRYLKQQNAAASAPSTVFQPEYQSASEALLSGILSGALTVTGTQNSANSPSNGQVTYSAPTNPTAGGTANAATTGSVTSSSNGTGSL